MAGKVLNVPYSSMQIRKRTNLYIKHPNGTSYTFHTADIQIISKKLTPSKPILFNPKLLDF